ncbi:MAG: hypothetical protein CEE38_06540 [Planctomycetes bacterium B3_Pla]|nr:MAG: hypothetical protein CEE38_06540 [Planctomycetes bacterium B3_Pla]
MCRKLTFLIFLGLVLGTVLTSEVKADLVAYWRLDEGSGTTAYDSSGNGNDGTSNGDPQWVVGYFGGALEFDGSDDWLDCGNDPSLDLTTWTIMFWLNLNENKNYNGFIIKGLDAAENYEVLTYGDGHFHFPITFTDGSRTFGNTSAGVCVVGEWAHYTYSYDSAEGRRFYKNGSLIFEDTESGTPQASTASLAIGNEQSTSRVVNGAMDDVRIYNNVLAEPEILAAMEGGENYPYALGPNPPDGALHEDTWVNLSWSAGDLAVSHDVYFGNTFDDVNDGAPGAPGFRGNQTSAFYVAGFPGFAYPDGLVPGTTYYWRIDEVNDADPNSPWKGPVWSFSIPPKTAYHPDPANGAEFVDPNVTLSWTPGFGAKLHTVYLGDNFDDVNDAAAGGLSRALATFSPAGPLELEKVYYWRVDEFDVVATYKGDIWSFTTPGAVGNPQPANGAVDVQMTATLSWTPADNAASHELYFGADADAVKNATTASPEYIGPKALGAESYDSGGLAWDSSYAWRVDEVYPDGTVKGLVWSFSTADFILVDDFESYNDIDPPDPNSNRIFDKWIDGFGTTTNGALVGNDMPPYAEQTIVHGGAQSMIYRYDNANMTSEATMTLIYPRDWTKEGVTKLSLWFRGASGNSAERMFVALNGTAVVYHDDAAATQTTQWTEWVIDLAAFAGVDLTNVNSITLGFGTKNSPAPTGGPGTMYFDDARLVR